MSYGKLSKIIIIASIICFQEFVLNSKDTFINTFLIDKDRKMRIVIRNKKFKLMSIKAEFTKMVNYIY